MYGREGVPLGRVTRVIAFCIATNWIGFFVLAGALFASGALVPPPTFPSTFSVWPRAPACVRSAC